MQASFDEVQFNNICLCCLGEKDLRTSSQLRAWFTSLNPDLEQPLTIANKMCPKCQETLQLINDFKELCRSSYYELKNRVAQLVTMVPEERPFKYSQVFVDPDHLADQFDDNDVQNNGESDYEDSDGKPESLVGQFICHICDNFFETLAEYKEHKGTHIWDLGVKIIKRVCKLCNETDSNGYLQHIKQKHPDYRPNKCKRCGKCYQQQNHLQSHLMTHIEGRKYICQGCGQNFQNTKRLKYHIVRTKHSATMFHCPECGIGSPTFEDFRAHFRVHYAETITRKFYPCYYCKNIYMRQSNVKEHNCDVRQPAVSSKHLKKSKKCKLKDSVLPTHNVLPHKCNRCLATFAEPDELLCHQVSLCTEATSYPCLVCQKEFKTNYLLTSHMRNLHEDRKFICDFCGYKCVSEAKLILHKVSHRKERSFKCEMCPLSFKDLKGWKTHQTAHENKRFECYLCAKKFRSIVTIRIHMGCHIESLKTFTCDFCPKKYGRLVDRDRHLAVHTGEFVKCSICSKEYRTAKALEHHVELVHHGVRYNCKYCTQSLASRRQMYEHLFLHRGFKPFNCPECSRAFLKKDRFQKHLRTHNIKFDEKIHGYREKDGAVAKLIDSCVNRSTAETTATEQESGSITMPEVKIDSSKGNTISSSRRSHVSSS